jgi:transglutaminase-like putative cysteine protease
LVSVYVPEMGWCEFDPTNNIISGNVILLLPMGDYLIFPTKRNYFSSGEHKVKVEVDVIQFHN